MKRLWRNLKVLAVVLLASPTAVSADDLMLQVAIPASGKSGSNVTIKLFRFQPGQLEVNAGAKVDWSNQDDVEHTVTSDTPESRDGRFDSRLSGKDATFTFTFTEPGTYTYFCSRHQSMRGEIRVK